MYVRNGELGEAFEDLFGLFHKSLVSIQCTQTHVVLSKEKKTRDDEAQRFVTSGTKGLAAKRKEKTDLHGSPPANVDAPRPVLEGNSPAIRDEARRLEGLYEVHRVPYHLLRLRRRPRLGIHPLVRRLVKLDFVYRRLKHAQWIPRGAHVDFVYGTGHQRVAFLEDRVVGWIGLACEGVLI